MPPARIGLALATAVALAIVALSLARGPMPLVPSVVALAAYLAVVLVGALVPSLSMFADVASRGAEGARGVALTFDDGPDPVTTREVLATLASRGARATFFVVGEKVEAHPDVLREIVAAGHGVGVHGHVHDRLFALRGARRVRDDLERAIAAVVAVTGERPRWLRPPVGQTNPTIARVADELDLRIVGWSARGLDGVATTPEKVVARVVPRLRDGAIVLLHDAAERGGRVPSGVAALGTILDALAARNLETVALDALVDG